MATKLGIADLKKKTDAELIELFGYDRKLEDFKEALEEGDKLTGKAREKVEDRINEMLTPRVYPEDLKYTVESAKRSAKTGKEAMNDCCCASVID
jgi:hypothetical protein